MKNKTAVFFFLFILAITSCRWELSPAGAEPDYPASVVWRTEARYQSSWANPFISGAYGYFPENNVRYQDGPYESPGLFDGSSRLLKIDLDTGELQWKTEIVPVAYTDQAHKMGDYIYLPLHGTGIIHVYHDGDGSLAATVKLGDGDREARDSGVWHNTTAVYNNYILWGNRPTAADFGLMRFDTTRVDFGKDPGTEQVVKPELLWTSGKDGVWTNILVEDGTVYFLTDSPRYYNRSTSSILVSLDAETGEVHWKKELSYVSGEKENSLIINGDKLHILDFTPSCYNKQNGETLYGWDSNDFYEFTEASPFLQGITLYNNKLYYTTGYSSGSYVMINEGVDPGLIKNIVCLDPGTGLALWGDLVPKGSSLSTNPVVRGGKVFAVTDQGIRVYNAENGKLIGVNRDFTNYGRNHVLQYKDMIIFPDRVTNKRSYITAIKAE